MVGRIINQPLPYQPDILSEHNIGIASLSSDLSPLEILEAAISFDECMTGEISSLPVAHEIKELFDSLAIFEDADETNLKKIRTMFSR